MSLEKIIGQSVIDHLKAGHPVFLLYQADMTSLTIADWLTGEFAVDVSEAEADAQKIPPPAASEEKEAGLGKNPGTAPGGMVT